MRVLGLVPFSERLLERSKARVHLRCGDLGVGGLGKTKLAHSESGVWGFMVVANGRPEGAAQDRSVRVEVAGLGRGIEDRTGIGVEGLFEELDLQFGIFVLRENAGSWIAGKKGGEMCAGSGDAGLETLCFGWVFELRLQQSGAQAFRVERSDLEDAMAAWGAAGMAEEM